MAANLFERTLNAVKQSEAENDDFLLTLSERPQNKIDLFSQLTEGHA
jgi:hypothetical protein